MGGSIRNGNLARIIVPMLLTSLFALSALAFSGIVLAGDHGHNPQGPYGSAWFNLETYSLGDTMTIEYSGGNGAGANGEFFQALLKNPSGAIVAKSAEYYGTSTQGTLTYTLKATDQTGTWTTEMTYNIPGRRFMKVTVLGSDTANVPGSTVDRLTLVQVSYDPASGAWVGRATLLDNAGAPIAGATVVLQYSTDGGLSWRNTRQGSRVTDSAGQAMMSTTGPVGMWLRVTYATDNLVSNVVVVA